MTKGNINSFGSHLRAVSLTPVNNIFLKSSFQYVLTQSLLTANYHPSEECLHYIFQNILIVYLFRYWASVQFLDLSIVSLDYVYSPTILTYILDLSLHNKCTREPTSHLIHLLLLHCPTSLFPHIVLCFHHCPGCGWRNLRIMCARMCPHVSCGMERAGVCTWWLR